MINGRQRVRRWRSGLTELVSFMGSSILSEVDDASIVRTGLSNCYWRSLGRLPAYRLLTPRSGLERSDFVRWPIAPLTALQWNVGCWGKSSDYPSPAVKGPAVTALRRR